MAITSGAGPHRAWLTVNGITFPIAGGGVSQSAKRKTSSFNVAVPLSYPGAYDALSDPGVAEASVSVLAHGATEQLIVGYITEVKSDLIGRVINVGGHDKSSDLHNNKSSEKWLNKMPSDIVSDLIGRVGLSRQYRRQQPDGRQTIAAGLRQAIGQRQLLLHHPQDGGVRRGTLVGSIEMAFSSTSRSIAPRAYTISLSTKAASRFNRIASL